MATAVPFPNPLIIPPLSTTHKQTIILLHGRGSTAQKFGPVILATPLSQHINITPPTSSTTTQTTNQTQTQTLPNHLPNTKFIFPSAPRSRATIYKRSLIPQWFDSWHADGPDPDAHEWMMVDGLQQTVRYIHSLLRDEVSRVGAGNVVLGGISQGCAAGLVALLLWEGERLGAFLGMCGRLPFRKGLDEVVDRWGSERWEDSFDPFEHGDDEVGKGNGRNVRPTDVAAACVQFLREQLELEQEGVSPASRPRAFGTPVFTGHGDEDENVPIHLGAEAAGCLKAMGIDTSWNEYHGLGHWYSGPMLADMVTFLRIHTDWAQDGETNLL
ncbi:phospholipase/carboxylesterase family protein-like protein [Cercophora scortea]|uniref:Phospholipase/carboxylesterase family protein-like protein n=1 Tax=Cercophora scortea TaxID=314031 RepID=A0AAE0MEE4_9PEZI|nr:phospholipase/carboxylesterase family protein-like protein [Cercophora scortea]